MALQHSYAKIGENRGKKRVWLEGLRLSNCGFVRGARYHRIYNLDSGVITLLLADDGEFIVSGRKRGEKEIAIVDICSADLVKITGDAERVRADFSQGKITITKHHFDRKQFEREAAFRDSIAFNSLTEGGLCAGIGMASAAISQGINDKGLTSSVSWIVDRERKYLQVACDNNPVIDDNTTIFEASLEEIEPDLLSPVDIMQVSLPCTGHSIAGKSKNKIKAAEEHKTDATAVFGLLNVIQGVNPAVIVSENVKEARDSATYLLIKAMLIELGYNIHEIDLDEKQAGSLEKRSRWWFIAVSKGIDTLDISKIVEFEKSSSTLADVLEPIPADSDMWADNQYLKDKAVKDAAAGKGFANRQLVAPDADSVGTIGRHYNKRRSTEPFLIRGDGKERLLTPAEHARVKGAPIDLIKDVPATTAHEGLGQGILWNHGRGIGQLIAEIRG